MSTIAIIGCGEIGSRHLQALSLLPEPAEILLVDPSEASRVTALQRWGEVTNGRTPPVHDLPDTAGLPPALDVAIVATTASVRRGVVEDLLARTRVAHLILEKFLFQRLEDCDAVAGLLESTGTTAWVNCPRRLWPAWREAAGLLALGGGPFSCRVTASTSNPLASNAVHWLDLLSYLDPGQRFELAGDRLVLDRQSSRHEGLVEFTGTLYGFSSAGGVFEYTVYPTGAAPMLVEIASPAARLIVREFEQTAWIAQAEDDWAWREKAFPLVYQSRITKRAVADLLARGRCDLAEFAESCRLHQDLLRVFLDRYRAETNEVTSTCPIT